MRIERQAAASTWWRRDLMISFTAMFVIGPLSAALADDAQPLSLLLDETALAKVRQRLDDRDPALGPAMEKLQSVADKSLKAGPFSVVDKPFLPPSGFRGPIRPIGLNCSSHAAIGCNSPARAATVAGAPMADIGKRR